MGSISNYSELELLDHLFNAAYTPASTVYLALCTADPTDAGTGASMNEVANSGSYVRKAVTYGAAASRRVTQSGTVTYDAATGSWGTVSHWAIVDSATHGAGNMLAHGAFAVPKSIVSGSTPSVATSETYVEFSAGYVGTAVANKLLDLMFRNTAYSKPDTYVALCTATVSDSSTGSTITEPSGNNYSRKQVNINGGSSPTWDVAASGALSNTHTITMATPSGSWGTIVAMAICSASSAGDVICYDNGVADQAVALNDTVQFAAGALDVSLS